MVPPSADDKSQQSGRAMAHAREQIADAQGSPRTARSPAKRRTAICCVVAAALCWTGYLNLQSPYTTGILETISGETRDPLAGIDSLVQKATADGNAVVVFEGFSPERSADATFISKVYFRGNYAAYPRRIFVCDDAERFDHKQVAIVPFAPSETWLGLHDVHCILYFKATPGNVECIVHKL
jgi:hypothetical protein